MLESIFILTLVDTDTPYSAPIIYAGKTNLAVAKEYIQDCKSRDSERLEESTIKTAEAYLANDMVESALNLMQEYEDGWYYLNWGWHPI